MQAYGVQIGCHMPSGHYNDGNWKMYKLHNSKHDILCFSSKMKKKELPIENVSANIYDLLLLDYDVRWFK